MNSYIDTAKEVLEVETDGLLCVSQNLDSDSAGNVEAISGTTAKTIICGMGKSVIIGKKIAATFTSTGAPSFFMHLGEAYHGDLGMVSPNDIFIAQSNSGKTHKTVKLIPFLTDNGNILISITENSRSTLAQAEHFHLNVGIEKEACPLQLAPTASTTAAPAMDDALAFTLMKACDFQPENFARFHPGGSFERRLLSRIENEMITENLPLLSADATSIEVISAINQSGLDHD